MRPPTAARVTARSTLSIQILTNAPGEGWRLNRQPVEHIMHVVWRTAIARRLLPQDLDHAIRIDVVQTDEKRIGPLRYQTERFERIRRKVAQIVRHNELSACARTAAATTCRSFG